LSLTLAVLLLPAAAHAKIRDPSFQELCNDASVIVVVHAKAILPAPISTTGVLVSSLLVSALVLWRWRKTSKARAILGAILVGVFTAFAGTCLSASLDGAHRSVALAEVQRTLKGSASGHLAVFHDSNFACDMSELASGKDYVLFLEGHLLLGYRLSWYHWSVWQVAPEGVEAPYFYRDGQSPVPAEIFFRDVSRLQR
jgi:hypothetical protein